MITENLQSSINGYHLSGASFEEISEITGANSSEIKYSIMLNINRRILNGIPLPDSYPVKILKNEHTESDT